MEFYWNLQVIIIIIIMDKSSAPSRVSPRSLPKTNKKQKQNKNPTTTKPLRTNGGRGMGRRAKQCNSLHSYTINYRPTIQTLSKSFTTTNPQTTYIISNLRQWQRRSGGGGWGWGNIHPRLILYTHTFTKRKKITHALLFLSLCSREREKENRIECITTPKRGDSPAQ